MRVTALTAGILGSIATCVVANPYPLPVDCKALNFILDILHKDDEAMKFCSKLLDFKTQTESATVTVTVSRFTTVASTATVTGGTVGGTSTFTAPETTVSVTVTS
jgi:hypothetical protein